MISKLLLKARRVSRELWVRAALISMLAVLAALISPVIRPIVPFMLKDRIDEESVRSLLDVLANSMLAVTTFSLTIMVTTHLTASQQVTPRAHRVLRQDHRTQTVLATFLGAFVFSLTGIVMIQTGLIGQDTYPLLYLTTLAVLTLVIVAILRWIGHLSSLGSVEETTRRVQDLAASAIDKRRSYPFLGAQPSRGIPSSGHGVKSERSGFLQHVDISAISETIGDDARFHLAITPGSWVNEGDVIGILESDDAKDGDDDDRDSSICACFTFGDTRTFEQDAAFGTQVLVEIGQRALSPGVNDPQTANDVMSRLLTIFADWSDEDATDEDPIGNVYVPPLEIGDMVSAAFLPLARDGKEMFEVHLHLQRALTRLSRHDSPRIAEAAKAASNAAFAYAKQGDMLEADIERLRKTVSDNRYSAAS